MARLLVVDDDRVVAEMYRIALSRAGHEVLVANDGVAALRAAAEQHPDLIFLDVRMPRMDGVEVLRNLRSLKSTKDIAVVMLSNYDEPGLIRQTLSLGAAQYLVKAATNPAELDRVVAQVMASDGKAAL